VLAALAEGPRPTTQLLCAASRRLGGLGAIPIAAIAPLLVQLEREGLVVALRDPDLRGERPELPRYIWSLPAQVAGDTAKALHHTVSTAAALCNWHRALLGEGEMRPGLGSEAQARIDASEAA
jgi:hypothetical protein